MQGSNYPLFSLAGCTTDIMTSDHSPVFATFEVGVTSQFVSKNGQSGLLSSPLDTKFSVLYMLKEKGDLKRLHSKKALPLSPTKNAILFHSSFLDSKYTDSQGEIEFLHCYATLKTKSQTKFYIEFHSSCLESMGLPIFILSVFLPLSVSLCLALI